MKDFDLEYICTTMGNLSGVPVRIFEGDRQVFYHAVVTLPRDPILLYRDGIRAVRAHLGYYGTPQFHYYGIVNAGETKVVVGPTFPVCSSDQELRELAFRADVPPDETEAFVQGIRSIIPLPLESLIWRRPNASSAIPINRSRPSETISAIPPPATSEMCSEKPSA